MTGRRPGALRGLAATTVTTVTLLAAAVTLAACSNNPTASSTGTQSAKSGSHGHPPTSAAPTKSSRSSTPKTTTTTVPPTTTTTEQPGWTPVSMAGSQVAVDQRTITGTDGGTVTVYRFRADAVHYDLHVGSGDPPTGAAIIAPTAGPAIGAAEAPLVVGAFNGGFKEGAGAGGFELNGQVLEPLVAGDASLVIDADGSAHIGVWGQTVPVAGEQVASVRQNLPPLVTGGQPSPQVNDVTAWGATLGGGSTVARSALGQDAQGNLLYAGGMSLDPADLAGALVTAGAESAMELDINPEWVQLAYAPTPGAALIAGVPGQGRPADQYQQGWSRDFVVALAGRPG